MASQDWFEKDFYAILGVPQDADQGAIKKAYRKLARKHHPDQNAGDAAAEQRFKDIGEANAVLSDPKQREEYDAIRQMAHGGARFRAGGPGGNGGFEDVFSAFGGAGASGCASTPAGRAVPDSPTSTTCSRRCSGEPPPARAALVARAPAPTRSPGSARRAARGQAPTCRHGRR